MPGVGDDHNPFVNVFEIQGELISRYLINVDIALLLATNPSTYARKMR